MAPVGSPAFSFGIPDQLAPERSTLEREVQLLGMGGKVRFLGWVEGLAPVLARWDVFVLPLLEEGAGLAALEAMAAGLPVIATAVGGIPEIVEDGRTGWLVPPGDPGALGERIHSLLRKPDTRRAMGAVRQLAGLTAKV